MNQNVNPVLALIIILVAVSMLSFKFWARGEALQVRGPDQMKLDQSDNLYININDTLYKLSADNELLAEYRLSDFGIYEMVGDFGFFSNGDILIRKGEYAPSFIDNILRYFRISDMKPPAAAGAAKGLYRCNLQTTDCYVFSEGFHDLDSAYHIAIDRETDNTYITDTSRHRIYKFAMDGTVLAEQRQGYFFPNQISFVDNRLYVADTNHHRIQIASTENEDFAQIEQGFQVTDLRPGDQIWTYSFARVGANWWVNNMNRSMAHGAVLIYDNKWRFSDQIDLPENADPIDIQPVGNHVFISDLDNIEIYIFDTDGKRLDVALPEEIIHKLQQLRDNKRGYQDLESQANILLVVLLVAGFVAAYLQARWQKDPALHTRSEKISINIRDPGVNWIDRNRRRITLVWVAYGAGFVLMLMSAIGMYLTLPDKKIMEMMAFLLVMMIIFFVILRRQLSINIGYIGDLIVIKNGSNAYAVGKGDRVYYSDNYILIDQVYIPFNGQNSLFHTQGIVKNIMPRLQDANYVKRGVMMNMIIKRMSRRQLLAILVGLISMFYLVFANHD